MLLLYFLRVPLVLPSLTFPPQGAASENVRTARVGVASRRPGGGELFFMQFPAFIAESPGGPGMLSSSRSRCLDLIAAGADAAVMALVHGAGGFYRLRDLASSAPNTACSIARPSTS
jgi:hypothetical protein